MPDAILKRRRREPPINRVADRHVPEFRRAFLNANNGLRRAVSARQLRQRIQQGDAFGAINDMPWRSFRSALDNSLMRAIENTMQSGADVAGEEMERLIGFRPERSAVRPQALRNAAQHTLATTQQLMQESRAALRQIVERAMQGNPDVKTLAGRLERELRQSIGITRRQAATLERYRSLLAQQKVPQAQQSARIRDMTDRLIAQRANLIARHESFAAASAGQYAEWQQAIEEGYLDPDVKRMRLEATDEHTCPICKGLHRQVRGMNEEFESTFDGTKVLHGPAHVGCRGTEVLVIPDI
jgi:hypothetical protein